MHTITRALVPGLFAVAAASIAVVAQAGTPGETLTIAAYTLPTKNGKETTNMTITTHPDARKVTVSTDYSIECGNQCSPLAPSVGIRREDYSGTSQSGASEKAQQQGHIETSMALEPMGYTFRSETLEVTLEIGKDFSIRNVQIKENGGSRENLTDTLKWEITESAK